MKSFLVENMNCILDSIISYEYGLRANSEYGQCACIGAKFYNRSILDDIKFTKE